jgi:hypothetical protein
MNEYVFITIVGLSIASIAFGYVLDYKNDKEGFKKAHQVAKWIGLVLLIIMVFDLISKNIFPLKSNYGLEHNSFRLKEGIPIIEGDWREEPSWGNQYRTWYVSPKNDSLNCHTKKKIEFNIWGAVCETDYFEPSNKKETYASQFNYSADSMSYFRLKEYDEKDVNMTKAQFLKALNKLGCK